MTESYHASLENIQGVCQYASVDNDFGKGAVLNWQVQKGLQKALSHIGI